jgi:hypothetical protein
MERELNACFQGRIIDERHLIARLIYQFVLMCMNHKNNGLLNNIHLFIFHVGENARNKWRVYEEFLLPLVIFDIGSAFSASHGWNTYERERPFRK